MTEHPHHRTMLQQYLIEPCTTPCEQPQFCMNYHSQSTRRRPPYKPTGEFAYSPHPCQSPSKCLGELCKFAHSSFQTNFHPINYKTQWCQLSDCSGPAFCHFAHQGVQHRRSFKKTWNLDLNTFKVHPCKVQGSHNHKLCEFFHSQKDRRRTSNESTQMCVQINCNDQCKKAHNRVQQLYHSEKYKRKFCTLYPNKIEECQYGSFCSFAHSEQEIKIQLLHTHQKTHEFYVNYYKTAWCPFINQHDKSLCVYAHNWQDFRRKPEQFIYEPTICPNWRISSHILAYEEGGCQNMMSCGKCHGWKELEFHPKVYNSSQNKKKSPFKQIQNSLTPNPHSYLLSPQQQYSSFSPFASSIFHKAFEPQNRVQEIRELNENSDCYFLHRGLNVNAKSFKTKEKLTPKVKTFLYKYRLFDLSNYFAGVPYQQIPHIEIPQKERKRVLIGWNQDIEELAEAQQLINEDIPIFTGQKQSESSDLTKFSLGFDLPQITVSFFNPLDVPISLKCPITHKLFRDPVIFPVDGRTYERQAITQYLKKNYSMQETQGLLMGLVPNNQIRQELLKRYE